MQASCKCSLFKNVNDQGDDGADLRRNVIRAVVLKMIQAWEKHLKKFRCYRYKPLHIVNLSSKVALIPTEFTLRVPKACR